MHTETRGQSRRAARIAAARAPWRVRARTRFAAVVACALTALALSLQAQAPAPASLDGVSSSAQPPQGQTAQAPTPAPSARSVEFPPAGNMAQLMRAVYFTNSNLIFTVQTRDPGAPPAPTPTDSSTTAGFSFVDWGAGIYTGWQLVDNAAAALADASTLMMTPGRSCENGRAVPVGDSNWARYTQEMYDAAIVVYAASRSRSQEAVSEATGLLSDACFNCHQAYRDRRVTGRGGPPVPGDPAANADRCLPLAAPAAGR
jgi:hypothetical protein